MINIPMVLKIGSAKVTPKSLKVKQTVIFYAIQKNFFYNLNTDIAFLNFHLFNVKKS